MGRSSTDPSRSAVISRNCSVEMSPFALSFSNWLIASPPGARESAIGGQSTELPFQVGAVQPFLLGWTQFNISTVRGTR
eukprot:5340932-Prymnesium_polylepis.1